MTITDDVVTFICDTDATAIPPAARQEAARALLDTVGVALAGMAEPTARIVVDALGLDGHGEATVLGTDRRASPLHAALASGTAAHALDYDDTQPHLHGHPSAPLMPAVIATAEVAGASGADVVTAFLLGFEVECKVGRAMGASHYDRGFHATSTIGVLGAAAAAARILRLDLAQTAAALGIAASTASGLRANFGSMTKPFHVGNAAHGGVLAALLARGGFTAADVIFDGALGFTRVFSPESDGDVERIGGFGEPWEALEPGIGVKKYPCCYRAHRAADAALAIVAHHDPAPDAIEAVEVRLPAGEAAPDGSVGPMIHPRPRTGLEGKFSMPYVMAAAFLDRELKIGTFADDRVLRPELQAFLPRVRSLSDADRLPDDPAASYTEVAVRLRDGRELMERVFFARGDAAGGDPLPREELEAKYRDCAAAVLPAPQVERSLDLLRDIESLPDVRELTAALALNGSR